MKISTNPCIRVEINLCSLEQFYEMVRWLNAHAGRGKPNWTSYGRIKRHIIKHGHREAIIAITSPSVNLNQVAMFFEKLVDSHS